MNIKQNIKSILSFVLMLAIGLSIGLAAKYGWQYINTPPEVTITNTSHHFENTEQKLIIYTTSWCQYCKKVKTYLQDNNVAFENRDIELGDKSISKLYQSIGVEGVPQIVIGDKIIHGANIAALEIELKAVRLL